MDRQEEMSRFFHRMERQRATGALGNINRRLEGNVGALENGVEQV